MNLDEVDDATFDLHCPVKLLDESDMNQVLRDIEALSPQKEFIPDTQDTESSPTNAKVDSILEKEGVYMYNKPPPPLPVLHHHKQVTLAEAWERKLTLSVTRKSKSRSNELYTFVHSTMYCDTCFPDSGNFRISVGDERYNKACLGTKWFDTEFIASFVTLLSHDVHIAPPQFLTLPNCVKVITCHFPTATVMEHQVTKVDDGITKLLLVAFSSNHFAVLEFNLLKKTVSVFDGLNLSINQWKDHVIRTLREYGIMHLTAIPKATYTTNRDGKSVTQRLEVRWSNEHTWIVTNSVYMRQKDGHNCGPIACCKVMEVLGFVEEGTIMRLSSQANGFRKAVMKKYNDLIAKYNDELVVTMRTREDEDGNVHSNEICICGDLKELDGLYALECCGRKVHIDCLASYLQTVPFCMFCGHSLSSMYHSLPERTFSQQHTLSQVVPPDDDTKNGIEDDTTATTTSMTTTTALTTEPAATSNESTVPPSAPANVVPDTNEPAATSDESTLPPSAPANVVPNDDDVPDDDVSNTPKKMIEDINRMAANDKKRKMQEWSAEKEMKRRGDELIAEGLGVGAVVTCKVDYRTFVHAEGLVCIVYKCSDYGGAIVCTENGVLTHDGSKKDYYVPSDKFVIQAGADEPAAIPDALMKVRKDILAGTYDYDNMPRISYSKQHQKSTSATSPCKRVLCGCKGNCGSRCGCRKKNIDCTSGCGCSGNCNWRRDGK